MGGRGSSSGKTPAGGASTLSNIIQQSPESTLSQLQKVISQGDLSKADFTANGSAVRLQSVTLESGSDKVEIYFSSRYEPTQVTNPSQPVKVGIYANVWKNGRPVAIRTISETKTKSLKNAKRNYENMLSEWKKATKQNQISF